MRIPPVLVFFVINILIYRSDGQRLQIAFAGQCLALKQAIS